MRLNNSSDFDLDLFFRNDFFLMHFATAGLHISDSNFFNNNHNDTRYFLKNLSLPPFKFELNPNLQEILSIKSETDREFNVELYTADFIRYAQKGLFSYDRTFIENSSDIHFHLVAYPILNCNYNYFLYHIFGTGIEYEYDYDSINSFIAETVRDNYWQKFKMEF